MYPPRNLATKHASKLCSTLALSRRTTKLCTHCCSCWLTHCECSVLISTSPTELIFTSALLEEFALTPSASDSTSSLYGLTSPHHCKEWPSICCTDTPSMPSTLLDQVEFHSIWESFGSLTATAYLAHTPIFCWYQHTLGFSFWLLTMWRQLQVLMTKLQQHCRIQFRCLWV